MNTPIVTRRVPFGTETPPMPFSELVQEGVESADEQRADCSAPEAADAADDEHRERDEGQIEVDLLGVDAPEQVDEEAAGEPGKGAARA